MIINQIEAIERYRKLEQDRLDFDIWFMKLLINEEEGKDMSKIINLGNEENPTFEELQERINSERKALQERVNNNAEILKVLFDYQCKEARVFNHEGAQMILPIEKLEMVIKDLNDLKEWIKKYDTIEDFLYQ